MNKEEYSKYKRCMEWYCTDPVIREKMDKSPEKAIRELGYYVSDPNSLYRAIRWYVFRDSGGEYIGDNPYIAASMLHDNTVKEKIISVHQREGYNSEKLYAFLQCTRNRCRIENRLLRVHELIYYYPFAFELSKGCSVQCPFCGFSANEHQGDFLYTEENISLFRDIISFAYEYAGPILRWCPLYFATEPMDNPDYEKFMLEFQNITGGIPQTTTALADKYSQRIKEWMTRVGEETLRENASVRISIRSLMQFKKIASLYTPEELFNVEMLANNPESVHRYSDSGRAMKNPDGFLSKHRTKYSICCVSGMKVNLVEKSVEFIEPEIPDEEFPLGYRVRDKRYFETAEEFANIVREFDEAYVFGILPRNRKLCFNKNISVEEEPERFVFAADEAGYQIGRNFFTEKIVIEIGNNHSFDEIMSMMPLSIQDTERLYAAVNSLFEKGYLRVK